MTDDEDIFSLLERINKFIDEAKEGVIWTSRDGRKFRSVKDFDDFYLISIIGYIERVERQQPKWHYKNKHLFYAEAVLRGLYVQDTNTPTIRRLY